MDSGSTQLPIAQTSLIQDTVQSHPQDDALEADNIDGEPGENEKKHVLATDLELARKIRFRIGYISALAGFIFLCMAIYIGHNAVSNLKMDYSDTHFILVKEHFAYAKLAAESIFVVSMAFIARLLFRVSERMFIPQWLLRARDEHDIEAIRAITGADNAARNATKITMATIKTVGEAVKAFKG